MRIFFLWTPILILPYLLNCQPLHNHDHPELALEDANRSNYNAQDIPKFDNIPNSQNEQIISVRITSSVAVGRGRVKSSHKIVDNHEINTNNSVASTTLTTDFTDSFVTTVTPEISTTFSTTDDFEALTEIPLSLAGANIEFIKQLQARKETRGVNNYEQIHSFEVNPTQSPNDTQFSETETTKTTFDPDNENYGTTEDVPLARSVPLSYSSKNYIRDQIHKNHEARNSPRLTTVSFNIVHDAPQQSYNEPVGNSYSNPGSPIAQMPTFQSGPKVYSEPAKIYSEPAKFYSEPAKIYSEPAKVYSEPAKIYSEPAKIYSEPAKFYSQPASLHLSPDTTASQRPWVGQSEMPAISNTLVSTTPLTTNTHPSFGPNTHPMREPQPEKNYEVDEKISVMTDGRTHGVQPQHQSDPENCKQEKCKVGYVVEGRQYRKYRVEERTSDGFIVGEYGVVRNEDGALRGVRYTADSDASPRLIHDALMKFLQLK